MNSLEKLYDPPDCDIVFFCGDFSDGLNCLNELKIHYKNKFVIWVAGNHDFYGGDILEYEKIFKNYHNQNFFFLSNDSIEVKIKNKKLKIIGTTLWPDYNLYGNLNEVFLQEYLLKYNKDHKNIKYNDEYFSHETLMKLNKESINFLESKLKYNNNDITIILTHHLPTQKSLSKQFSEYITNPLFANNLEYLFYNYKIDYWFHGHSHESCNYIINNTKIMSNPLGYYRDGKYQNKFWKSDFIIEI